MAFMVRDLMSHVLPDAGANARQLLLCEMASPGEPLMPEVPHPQPPHPHPQPPHPQPPHPQPPHPQPDPNCTLQTQTGQPASAAGPELASLAVLREQLRQALHP